MPVCGSQQTSRYGRAELELELGGGRPAAALLGLARLQCSAVRLHGDHIICLPKEDLYIS